MFGHCVRREMGGAEDFVKQWEGKGINVFDEFSRVVRTKYRERLSTLSWADVKKDTDEIVSMCSAETRGDIREMIVAQAKVELQMQRSRAAYARRYGETGGVGQGQERMHASSEGVQERVHASSEGHHATKRGRPGEAVGELIAKIESKRDRANKLREDCQINQNSMHRMEEELSQREAALRRERAELDDLRRKTQKMEADAAELMDEATKLEQQLSSSLENQEMARTPQHVSRTETPRDKTDSSFRETSREEQFTRDLHAAAAEARQATKDRLQRTLSALRPMVPHRESRPTKVGVFVKPDGLFCGIRNGRGGEWSNVCWLSALLKWLLVGLDLSDDRQTRAGVEKTLLLDLKTVLQRGSDPVDPSRSPEFVAFYKFAFKSTNQRFLDQGGFNDPGDFVENFLSLVCVTKACTRHENNYALEPGQDSLTSTQDIETNQVFVSALSAREPVSIESVFEDHRDTTDVPNHDGHKVLTTSLTTVNPMSSRFFVQVKRAYDPTAPAGTTKTGLVSLKENVSVQGASFGLLGFIYRPSTVHYAMVLKNNGQWWDHNDDRVTRVHGGLQKYQALATHLVFERLQ